MLATPVATPCRGGGGAGVFSPTPNQIAESLNLDIPQMDDNSIERPVPGALRLSTVLVESRLRRVFTPNVNGEYKVGKQIVDQWKDRKKGRKNLEKLFQSCGFNVDRGWGWKINLFSLLFQKLAYPIAYLPFNSFGFENEYLGLILMVNYWWLQ